MQFPKIKHFYIFPILLSGLLFITIHGMYLGGAFFAILYIAGMVRLFPVAYEYLITLEANRWLSLKVSKSDIHMAIVSGIFTSLFWPALMILYFFGITIWSRILKASYDKFISSQVTKMQEMRQVRAALENNSRRY